MFSVLYFIFKCIIFIGIENLCFLGKTFLEMKILKKSEKKCFKDITLEHD